MAMDLEGQIGESTQCSHETSALQLSLITKLKRELMKCIRQNIDSTSSTAPGGDAGYDMLGAAFRVLDLLVRVPSDLFWLLLVPPEDKTPWAARFHEQPSACHFAYMYIVLYSYIYFIGCTV